MKTEDIHTADLLTKAIGRIAERQPRDAESSPQKQPRPDRIATPRLDHIQFNRIEQSNSQAQAIAQQIRSVHEVMKTIDARLEQTQRYLESVVKMYPPYPPGSSERVEALRQFNALRKMIDHLTISPTADGMEKILGDPDLNPAARAWRSTSDDETRELYIGSQPVHTGKTGLDLPDPAGGSTDERLAVLLDRTVGARKTLQMKHHAFIADANRVIAAIS